MRQICMGTLYPDLCVRGVTTIWQEARTPILDVRDSRMINALRGKRLLAATVRVKFAQPRKAPMLWVPDAVAGAVGCARIGDSDEWGRSQRCPASCLSASGCLSRVTAW